MFGGYRYLRHPSVVAVRLSWRGIHSLRRVLALEADGSSLALRVCSRLLCCRSLVLRRSSVSAALLRCGSLVPFQLDCSPHRPVSRSLVGTDLLVALSPVRWCRRFVVLAKRLCSRLMCLHRVPTISKASGWMDLRPLAHARASVGSSGGVPLVFFSMKGGRGKQHGGGLWRGSLVLRCARAAQHSGRANGGGTFAALVCSRLKFSRSLPKRRVCSAAFNETLLAIHGGCGKSEGRWTPQHCFATRRLPRLPCKSCGSSFEGRCECGSTGGASRTALL